MGDEPASPDEPVRKNWFGMNQPRPRLPHYFRTRKRLRSLDEFEDPPWKGRTQFGSGGDDGGITFGGVLRDTLRWLLVFAVAAAATVLTWRWLAAGESCISAFGDFKIGWC